MNINFTSEGVAVALQEIYNITYHGIHSDMTSVLTDAYDTALTGSMASVTDILAKNKVASKEIVQVSTFMCNLYMLM